MLHCLLCCQWAFGMPLNKSRGYTEKEVEFAKMFVLQFLCLSYDRLQPFLLQFATEMMVKI